jgi:transcriptional regulator with XRE-family HTH domain
VATDRKLKGELLERLGVSPQRLSQLAKARKRELPMSTEQAVYTIAHDEGVDISKYLTSDETTEVRRLVSDLRNGGRGRQASPAPRKRRRVSPPKEVRVKIAGVDVGQIPALKQSHAEDAKRMSERVYPTLYIFENSVRDLIERVLKAAHGSDWWKQAVPTKVRDTAEKHRKDEQKDPWHGARGKREIDYVFLNDLWAIIHHNWADFQDLFPNQAWVQTLITSDMNVSRRVFAHMSPLDAGDIANIEAAFRKWTKQLNAAKGNLP